MRAMDEGEGCTCECGRSVPSRQIVKPAHRRRTRVAEKNVLGACPFVHVRVGRVSVGGVSHHAELSNPRVGAVRGLLKRTCRARAPMCTCVYVLSEEFPFTRRSGVGRA